MPDRLTTVRPQKRRVTQLAEGAGKKEGPGPSFSTFIVDSFYYAANYCKMFLKFFVSFVFLAGGHNSSLHGNTQGWPEDGFPKRVRRMPYDDSQSTTVRCLW